MICATQPSGATEDGVDKPWHKAAPVVTDLNNNEVPEAGPTDASGPTAGSLRSFYDGRCVFVTGGTGFLGKVLIEKLLRACGGLRTIYILLRPKRGLSSEQRYREFVRHPVFDRLRAKTPQLLEKVVCVGGDISLPQLGLSERDHQALLEQVSVVFHVAATVRFNEALAEAATLNTVGTKRVLELCAEMLQLQSVVHVSTAYSNPCRSEVDEVVYPAPMDPDQFVQCVQMLPGEVLNAIASKLQGTHPNTYTLTKSITEQLVAGYAGRLPVCIVRPSIVTGAVAEPYPGWIDNVYGITGIMMEIGRGTISSIMCDERCTMDVIPVDIVCNTLIAAAWETQLSCPSAPLRVYNCTSGQINGIKWHEYGRLTQQSAVRNPTKYVMLYPGFRFRTNRAVHKLVELLLHFLPAYLFDVVMRAQGTRPIMAKIARRFQRAADTGEYFAMHEWTFRNDNLRRLGARVGQDADGAEFRTDVSGLDWPAYIEAYMLGIRRYVLKDELDSLGQARAKLHRLLWVKRILQLATLLLAYYLLSWVLFRWQRV
ncbi:putative fatty acyl-CoA reductase CG5065 [Anopheles cruzii]|uniref:putative fatty acyl-CoA reductase CG5065 n=1 Tax=Anopheles cruzii TaxID=68878 RepID=UPI0022EC8DFD|nr:putative fatty acyl-CoA reductase CG5065 [Anopheles cruzii]